MARQILRQYDLYSDLVRLNNSDYFQITFSTPETILHFKQASKNYKPCSKNSVHFYLKNLQITQQKDVFLILKWLVTTHNIVRQINNGDLLQEILISLARMKKCSTPSHIEQYIYSELVRPYTQFIRKLCLLNSKLFSGNNSRDKENMLSYEQIWYMKYNLLKLGLKQLTKPCRQLLGFFSNAYPFLSTIKKIVNIDLVTMYTQLNKTIKSVLGITFQQIRQLQIQLANFENLTSRDVDLEQEPSLPSRVNDFFSSHQRVSTLQEMLE